MSHIRDLAGKDEFRPSRPVPFWRRRGLWAFAVLVLVVAIGIFIRREAAGGAPVVAAQTAIPVTTAAVEPRHVRLWSEFSGRLTAVDSAEVRPQVSGRITEIRFRDGQQVQAGDILFVIDPRPYEAAVAKAEADLATAQTNARLAHVELDRATRLMNAQAVARDFYDQRANASGVAEAAIKSAQAALVQAKLDVDHAYVKAPISGRASRAEITLGNLVQNAPAPLLTTIVSNNGIYADFDVDEQTYLQAVRAHAKSLSQEQRIPVELTLQGDSEHVYKGNIESFDNQIATGTGTIRARARFANEDGTLVPGMFASVRLANAADKTALFVPEDAVGSDQSKRFVLVVNPSRKVEFREVTLGQQVSGERVVLSGLRPGERIILDGLQRVQPGVLVDPHPSARREFASR
ncbi:MAG TPA: efflux RND transporter periplasmic adaptor subunit [Rhizomicrobium sp.]|jgi:multidrug efflux system membrane fusion protein|nr:efflux RND transporter periplasmic adaptor subunit [Rhizomicrobium sp.]